MQCAAHKNVVRTVGMVRLTLDVTCYPYGGGTKNVAYRVAF